MNKEEAGSGASARETVLALLDAAVATRPDDTALVDASGSLSYRQCDQLATYLAHRLKTLLPMSAPIPTSNTAVSSTALALGEGITVVSTNSPLSLLIFLAVWKLGIYVVPVSPSAPADMTLAMAAAASSRIILAQTPFYNPLAHAAQSSTMSDTTVLRLESVLKQREGTSIASLLSIYSSLSSQDERSQNYPTRWTETLPDSTAACLFTSSATSAETIKAVPLAHRHLVRNAFMRNNHLLGANRRTQTRISLGFLPLFHVMGLVVDFITGALETQGTYAFALPETQANQICKSKLGETAVHSVNPRALVVWASIAHFAPRLTSTVPFLLEAWREWYDDASPDARQAFLAPFSSLEAIIIGGAPVTEELLAWSFKNGIPLANAVGMTEVAGTLLQSLPPRRISPAEPVLQYPTETDRHYLDLLPDFEIELDPSQASQEMLDIATGFPGAPDPCEIEIGSMCVVSNAFPPGYANIEAGSHHTRSDGRTAFHTGDIYARHRHSGKLMYLSRSDDVLTFGTGEKMSCLDVERKIVAHSADIYSCIVLPSDLGLPRPQNSFDGKGSDRRPVLVCQIISAEQRTTEKLVSLAWKAVAAVNRNLSPHCRIQRDMIVVLDESSQTKVPMTTKGIVHRKMARITLATTVQQHVQAVQARARAVGNQAPLASSSLSIEPIYTQLVDRLALLFSLPSTEDLEPTTLLADMGLDSAKGTALIAFVNRTWNLSLAAHDVYSTKTPEDLARLVWRAKASEVRTGPPGAFAEGSASSRLSSSQRTIPRQASTGGDIAVVGVGLRLPEGIETTEEFWKAMLEGRDCVRSVPSERWDMKHFFDANPNAPGKMHISKGAWLKNVDLFDPTFFQLSPAEAAWVRPNQRLTLECSWEALEDAGIPPSSIAQSDGCVFVGSGTEDGYDRHVLYHQGFEGYTRFAGTGLSNSSVAGRLAYFFDLRGPAVTVETACSASSVAIDSAVKALRSGESSIALAGGVTTHLFPHSYVFPAKAGMASPRGRCATFDQEADGYVPAEGCIMYVLKRLSDAQLDRNRIHAVIKATAVQHDGKSQGLTAPHQEAQVSLMRAGLDQCGWTPSEIDLVEAHGTGTALGDPIECAALNQVFGGSRVAGNSLTVSSAKTTFGHTEEAAGALGLLKAIWTIKTRVAPVHLNFTSPSTKIDFDAIPMHVPTSNVELLPGRNQEASSLRAMVNSFGFTGTIATILIEGPPQVTPEPSVSSHVTALDGSSPSPSLFTLSAKSEASLLALKKRYLERISTMTDSQLTSLAKTSNVAREHFRFRWGAVASTVDQMKERLQAAVQEPGGASKPPLRPKTAFVFTGQTALYANMGTWLLDTFSVFRDTVDRCDGVFQQAHGFRLSEYLRGEHVVDQADEETVKQPILCAYQIAMATLLLAFSDKPSVIAAHSFGEIPAAYVSGAIDLETAIEFAIVRSRALAVSHGKMLAVFAPLATVEELVQLGGESSLSIAAINGARQIVVSGDDDAVDHMAQVAKKRGLKHKMLPTRCGFHSPAIPQAALDELKEWVEGHSDRFGAPKIRYASSALGRIIEPEENLHLNAEYWVQHARGTVRFLDVQTQLMSQGINTFIELGPSDVLTGLGRRIVAEMETVRTDIKFIHLAKEGTDPSKTWLSALCGMYVRMVPLDWRAYHGTIPASGLIATTDAPFQPFSKRRYWVEPTKHGFSTISKHEQQRSRKGDEYGFSSPVFLLSSKRWTVTARLSYSAVKAEAFQQSIYLACCELASKAGYTSGTDVKLFWLQRPAVALGTRLQVEVTMASTGTDFDVLAAPESGPSAVQRICAGVLHPSTKSLLTQDPLRGVRHFVITARRYNQPMTEATVFDQTRLILISASAETARLLIRYARLTRPQCTVNLLLADDADETDGSTILSGPEVKELRVRLNDREQLKEAVAECIGDKRHDQQVLLVHTVVHDRASSTLMDLIQAGPALQSVLSTLQALSDMKQRTDVRAMFVTCNADSASSLSSRRDKVAGYSAAAIGMVKNARFEVPSTFSSAIDLEDVLRIDNVHRLWRAIESVAEAEHPPYLVSVRAHEMLEPVLEQVDAPVAESRDGASQWSGSVVITGGMGGVGRHLATWIVSKHRPRRIVLLGRSREGGQVQRKFLAELETLGVQGGTRATYRSVDVSDQKQVFDLLDSIDAEVGMSAIIHAAGTLHDGLLPNLRWEDFESVLLSKCVGAHHLQSWTAQRQRQGCKLVLLSSIAATVGNVGQCNYVAANAVLDALACDARRAGLATTSLQLGVWANTGMARKLSSKNSANGNGTGINPQNKPKGVGVLPMSAEVGLEAFDLALRCGRPVVAFAELELDVLLARNPTLGPHTRFFSKILEQRQTKEEHEEQFMSLPSAQTLTRTTSAASSPAESVRSRETTSSTVVSSSVREVSDSYPDSKSALAWIKDEIMRLAGLSWDEVKTMDVSESLGTYGVDSLGFQDLVAGGLARFGEKARLPTEALFQWTIAQVSEFLAGSKDSESLSGSALLLAELARLLGSETELDAGETLVSLGLDSLGYTSLEGKMKDAGVHLPEAAYTDITMSLEQICAAVDGKDMQEQRSLTGAEVHT